MINKPVCSTLLGHLCSLVDTPSVLNHDGSAKTAVPSSPPSRNPVASPLFFKSAVAQEGDQTFPGQGHMDILKLCETEVPALSDTTRRMDIHVTAQGRVLFAVCSQFVRIEISNKKGKS